MLKARLETDAIHVATRNVTRICLQPVLLLSLAIAWALTTPSDARAERPNIDRVLVSRDDQGVLRFHINFASPVIIDPDDTVQVAIDADRDGGTGVDGLEYSLDVAGPVGFGPPGSSLSLLTAVDGKPVASHPAALRFSRHAAGYGFSSSSMTFTIPASAMGDPRRFDFYAFIRMEGELDEAPSHVLLPAGMRPWTYPKNGEPALDEAYPVETYVDGSDITLHERPKVVLAAAAATIVGIGAVLGAIGWSVQRLLRRNRAGSSSDGNAAVR